MKWPGRWARMRYYTSDAIAFSRGNVFLLPTATAAFTLLYPHCSSNAGTASDLFSALTSAAVNPTSRRPPWLKMQLNFISCWRTMGT